MTRYEIKTPRKRKDGKTFWLTIGSGFVRDSGGFSLVLDALPLSDADGNVRLLMVEPDARRDDTPPRDDRRRSEGLDDEIPF